MSLPNFICVGAQKAGTSTLFDVLKQSPDVYFPQKKELHFFEKPEMFKKGVAHYSSFFADSSNEKLRGEITPEYLFYDYVPKRIFDALGDVKIIILLRNPAARSYSQFNFHKMLQVEGLNNSFTEAIKNEHLEHSASTYNTWCEPTYYLSKSLYHDQVKRYLDVFGAQNVFVGIFEELFQKDQMNLNELFNFLELPAFEFNKTHSNPSVLNKSNASFNFMSVAKRNIDKIIPKSMTRGIANKLKKQMTTAPKKLSKEELKSINERYFIEDIKKTEQLLNKDLSVWYK